MVLAAVASKVAVQKHFMIEILAKTPFDEILLNSLCFNMSHQKDLLLHSERDFKFYDVTVS